MTDPVITPINATTVTTLLLIVASGRTVRADGDRLIVSRGNSLPPGLSTAIRRNKAELIALLKDAA